MNRKAIIVRFDCEDMEPDPQHLDETPFPDDASLRVYEKDGSHMTVHPLIPYPGFEDEDEYKGIQVSGDGWVVYVLPDGTTDGHSMPRRPRSFEESNQLVKDQLASLTKLVKKAKKAKKKARK